MPPPELVPANPNTELIFVVDCSTSMSGPRMEQSKRACMLFIQSLALDVPFNIIKFRPRVQA